MAESIIEYPEYIANYPIFSTQMCQCRLAEDDKRVKEDCYWYDEEQDMGAHIPYCKCKGTFPLETCGECEQYHSRYKRTNADRIRSMTDEELTAFMYTAYGCPMWVSNYSCKEDKGCHGAKGACWLDWLRQEATE